MAVLCIPFASVAEVMDKYFQEAAIILPGPPIQIFAQRAAPTVVLKSMQQRCGKFYYECKTLTGITAFFAFEIYIVFLLHHYCMA